MERGSVGPISENGGPGWGQASSAASTMRRPETVRRGANQKHCRHGEEMLEAKAERHEMAAFFHKAESLIFALGMVAPGSTRMRGRRPVMKIISASGRHILRNFSGLRASTFSNKYHYLIS